MEMDRDFIKYSNRVSSSKDMFRYDLIEKIPTQGMEGVNGNNIVDAIRNTIIEQTQISFPKNKITFAFVKQDGKYNGRPALKYNLD